ncbi:MAG: molybdopterin molybdotransferase MoeA [Actinobacteria bacterium]|nr:molybdopterin molybdotransferase MoeA [Actinomycetota bacterium]MCL5446624.1 molybdopterin molybdotransferase MoeA [Actinomycetota bacterium]
MSRSGDDAAGVGDAGAAVAGSMSDVAGNRPLVPFAEVRRRLLALARPLPAADLPLAHAHGKCLAASIAAPFDLPQFDNSAMDGYAINTQDVTGPGTVLGVAGFLPAGSDSGTVLPRGHAIRIMTGAPIPQGADAVVMLEYARISGNQVTLLTSSHPGDHIRRRGENVRAGDRVLQAGQRLGSAAIGLAANFGISTLFVHAAPMVGILATGDELIQPAAGPAIGAAAGLPSTGRVGGSVAQLTTEPEVSEPGTPSRQPPPLDSRLFDSNRPMLLAAAASAGANPVDLGCVPDDLGAIEKAVIDAAGRCDVVITTGGAGVGDRDWARTLLGNISTGTWHWLEAAIKPGKPFAFGQVNETIIACLPGNPVSALVGFELFCRPLLRTMAGDTMPYRPILAARLAQGIHRRPDGKEHLILSKVWLDETGDILVAPAGPQASHLLTTAAAANAIAFLPDGGPVEAGTPVEITMLDMA